MTSWKEGAFEKIKARAIGTFKINKPGGYGSKGPGPEDVGYVVAQNLNNSFGENEIFYTMFFEDFPGSYYIGFDYSGVFTPYQETLFTTEE